MIFVACQKSPETWSISGTQQGAVPETQVNTTWSVSTIDSAKTFNIDDYLPKGTYSVVKKLSNGWYTVYTVDPKTSNGKLDNGVDSSCLMGGASTCINFITKDDKIIYSNLKTGSQDISEDIWGLYKMYTNGVVFMNQKWDGVPCSGGKKYDFVYSNFDSLKKIYQDYTETDSCNPKKEYAGQFSADGSVKDKYFDKIECEKACDWKKTITKEFYDLPKWDSNRKKLELKAPNLEDAYFEYYKDEKPKIDAFLEKDNFSKKLEWGEIQGIYSDYSWTESEWVKFRVAKETRLVEKVKKVTIDTDVDVSKDIETINLFIVKNVDNYKNAKEIIEKYFISAKNKTLCDVNPIDTTKELDTNWRTNIFYDQNNWEVYSIWVSSQLSETKQNEAFESQSCFWVFPSSPGYKFVFNKNDYSKFLLFTTTQDPYPFNPRSFEF